MDSRERTHGGMDRQSVRFKVGIEGSVKETPELAAFLFDGKGELVDSAPVQKGAVELKATQMQLAHSRLFIAPALPKGSAERTPTISSLERAEAYEPVWRRMAAGREIELIPIPNDLVIRWLWCMCRVRGRVVRPVSVGGTTVDRPVCHARVHICEVDPWRLVIWRLPDRMILRIREELLRWVDGPWPRIPEPIPGPDPAPEFRFDPGVIDPTPQAIARMQSSVGESQAFLMRSASGAVKKSGCGCGCGGEKKSAAMTTAQPSREMDAAATVRQGVMPQELRAALVSDSVGTLRRALLDHLVIVRPWLCRWRWVWPYWYRCDEVAVVETDDQGRFDARVWYLCNGDKPDLYFWVEYSIGGVWTRVYHPPIACATHWNYPCGSEVTIHVTDPRVPWCGGDDTLPGKQVAVLSIGNGISMSEVQLHSAGAGEGLTTSGQPMGGSLEPHVWFGDGLIPSGVTHFRWSYRRLGSSGSFTALDRQVVRHYGEEHADGTLVFKAFLLGPDPAFSSQSLFRIKPASPPLGAGVVSSSWAPEVDGRSNTASAYFLTHLLEGGDAELAQGKYEMKLELFKSDGSVVDWTAEGIAPKEPTIPAPFGVGDVPTHTPPNERLFRNGAGHVVGFRVVVHVDNARCEAEIHDVGPAAGATDMIVDGDCGFIEYKAGAVANISFMAKHPRRFATFSFDLNRGSGHDVPPADAAGTVGDNPVNGYAFTGATFDYSKDISVADLLTSNTPAGSTPCTRAAFAETLRVWAMATDGWSRLDYLDRSATPKAFALEQVAPA